MAEPVDERRSLSAALRECSDRLQAGDGDKAPLRALQRVARSIVERGQTNSVKTVAFVIDGWVNDYYLNLAGDIVFEWKRVEDIRDTFLRQQASMALLELSDAIDRNDTSVLNALELLLVPYLDAVELANRLVGEPR